MAGPWEQYATPETTVNGPWQQYAQDSDRMSDPYYAAAKADYDKLIAKDYPAPGTSRLLGQGLTFNSADEILAGLSTPIEMAKAGNLNVGEAYKRAKAFQDVVVDAARKNSGALGTGAEIAGGIASGAGLAGAGFTTARALAPNAGLLARTASSAADAGIYGGVAGGMEGNSLAERGGNAAKGAALGAGVGGAVPVALTGARFAASPVLSNISARVNPEGFGNTQVARALIESGQTPQDIGATIAQAGREGQAMFTPADAMGNAGQRMLSTVARAPGEGRTDVVNFLEQRQAGQGRRVAGQLAEGFDSPQTAAQVSERMTRARDAVADAEYGAARQNAGPVDLTRTIAHLDSEMAPRPANIARDSIDAALDSVRDRLTNGQQTLTDFRAVQRIRNDLADQVQQAVGRQQGNRARVLGNVLRQMDQDMEAASPGFLRANRNFEAASRNIGAIGEGRTAATRGRTQDTIPAFQGLPQRGQEAFRAGYVDPLIEQTQGAAFGVNKARPFSSDAFQAESNAMAPGGARMQRQLGRENTMFETRAHALGGSRTADNLADASAMGVDPAMIGHVLQGNWMGALRSAMGGISNGLTGNTAAVRQQVGNVLLNRNLPPAAFERILKETVERITRIQGAARLAGRGLAGGLAESPLNRR